MEGKRKRHATNKTKQKEAIDKIVNGEQYEEMGCEFEHSSHMRNELIENSSCINDLIETHLYPIFHIIHMCSMYLLDAQTLKNTPITHHPSHIRIGARF